MPDLQMSKVKIVYTKMEGLINEILRLATFGLANFTQDFLKLLFKKSSCLVSLLLLHYCATHLILAI